MFEKSLTPNPSPNLSPKRREALKPPFPCREGSQCVGRVPRLEASGVGQGG